MCRCASPKRSRQSAVKEVGPGKYIYNLGQNFAGTIRLQITGPAGGQVTLRYGEMLYPDGRLMTENLRKARATDRYILEGDPDGRNVYPAIHVPRIPVCRSDG